MQTVKNFFNIEPLGDKIVISPLRSLGEFAIESRLADSDDPLLGIAEEVANSDVIVDFRHTDYFGSTAIEFFERLIDKVVGGGYQIAFCNFSDIEREITHVTLVDQRWPIYDTLEDAIAQLNLSNDDEPDLPAKPR